MTCWRRWRGPGVQVAIGARVGMLGYDIDRSAVRHYLGRVFATAASLILQARVYDTQAGPSCSAPAPALAEALAVPFLSRWAFDVELPGRLLIGTPAVASSAVELASSRCRWPSGTTSRDRSSALAAWPRRRDLALVGERHGRPAGGRCDDTKICVTPQFFAR
jgi:hypothetical protein